MTELRKEPQLFEENQADKRIKKKNYFFFFFSGLILIAFVLWPKAIMKTEGVLQAEKFIKLELKNSGTLKEVFHKKGDNLEKDELIANFENPELLKFQRQTEIEIGQLEDEKYILTQKQKHFSKVRERKRILYENGAIGKQQLEKAEFDDGVLTQEFQILEKKIQSAKRELIYLEEEIKSLQLKAPFKGVLLTDPIESLGNAVQKGGFVLEMVDPETYFLEVLIPEEDVQKISIGSKVEVKFHALPNGIHTGQVVQIAPRTSEYVEKVFKIKHVVSCEIKLEEWPSNLRYGMRASVKIYS